MRLYANVSHVSHAKPGTGEHKSSCLLYVGTRRHRRGICVFCGLCGGMWVNQILLAHRNKDNIPCLDDLNGGLEERGERRNRVANDWRGEGNTIQTNRQGLWRSRVKRGSSSFLANNPDNKPHCPNSMKMTRLLNITIYVGGSLLACPSQSRGQLTPSLLLPSHSNLTLICLLAI